MSDNDLAIKMHQAGCDCEDLDECVEFQICQQCADVAVSVFANVPRSDTVIDNEHTGVRYIAGIVDNGVLFAAEAKLHQTRDAAQAELDEVKDGDDWAVLEVRVVGLASVDKWAQELIEEARR